MPNPPSQGAPAPRKHWLVRALRALAVLILAIAAAYFVADQIASQELQKRKEAFRARFGKLELDEFKPDRPPAAKDAGRIYRRAAGSMAGVDEELGDWSLYDALTQGPSAFAGRGARDTPEPPADEVERRVREKFAALDEAFRLVEEARPLEPATLLENYELEGLLPASSDVLLLAHNVAARAIDAARSGDLEAACAWLDSGVHVACTLEGDPTLMLQMARHFALERALRSAEEVFNATDVPLPLGERYWTLLERAAGPGAFADSLAGEAGFMIAQEMPRPRIFWTINNIKTLELIEGAVSAFEQEPGAARQAALHALAEETRNWPVLYTCARSQAPTVLLIARGYDMIVARRHCFYVAVALRNHKHTHGAYPGALEAVAVAMDAAMLADPFGGGPLRYRAEGEGFVLYSLGPNQQDDGGGAGGNRDHDDIVWTAIR
ncbi:MAG: hypothetical protein KF886_18640 [Candidatus Hydrogenedentes bacterium]|nr:hypothetical protein [Candidatus Hydrogenedentota bacterium]